MKPVFTNDQVSFILLFEGIYKIISNNDEPGIPWTQLAKETMLKYMEQGLIRFTEKGDTNTKALRFVVLSKASQDFCDDPRNTEIKDLYNQQMSNIIIELAEMFRLQDK